MNSSSSAEKIDQLQQQVARLTERLEATQFSLSSTQAGLITALKTVRFLTGDTGERELSSDIEGLHDIRREFILTGWEPWGPTTSEDSVETAA